MFLGFANSEHVCIAFRAGTFRGGFAVFQGYRSGTLYLPFLSTFYTIACCHDKIKYDLILAEVC